MAARLPKELTTESKSDHQCRGDIQPNKVIHFFIYDSQRLLKVNKALCSVVVIWQQTRPRFGSVDIYDPTFIFTVFIKLYYKHSCLNIIIVTYP